MRFTAGAGLEKTNASLESENTMNVVVTGVSGFVGSHLAQALIGAGHQVRGLSRNAPTGARRKTGVEYVDGVDVATSTTLTAKMFENTDVVVHLVGIIQEATGGQTFQRIHVHGTGNVIDAAQSAGFEGRIVYMSALGAAPDAPSEYSRTKYDAEQLVQKAGRPYTIFRPSLIIGKDGEFVAQMADLVQYGGMPVHLPFPVIPVPGDGLNKFQPIWIDDLCGCVTKALAKPVTDYQTYEVGGATQLTFNDLLGGFAQSLHVNKPLVHAPVPMLNVVATVMESLMPKPPVTRDQLLNLGRDNITDSRAIEQVFGIRPLSFDQMLAKIYGA